MEVKNGGGLGTRLIRSQKQLTMGANTKLQMDFNHIFDTVELLLSELNAHNQRIFITSNERLGHISCGRKIDLRLKLHQMDLS